ncbi:unnamed protein product [Ranitomeya imitator]|uniref:DNA2/NAM7 helicase-like C-terminal domain-containing protein n=1 Tax=Ranitomeya imitator TaxID=111125 RepID=A0ABN9L3S7_9NEOB|nr:unnamed protein product [Ranitomeya imitator]
MAEMSKLLTCYLEQLTQARMVAEKMLYHQVEDMTMQGTQFHITTALNDKPAHPPTIITELCSLTPETARSFPAHVPQPTAAPRLCGHRSYLHVLGRVKRGLRLAMAESRQFSSPLPSSSPSILVLKAPVSRYCCGCKEQPAAEEEEGARGAHEPDLVSTVLLGAAGVLWQGLDLGSTSRLRPATTVYELAKNFNLEVSMFERLIRMGIPYVRLNYQHRMRPEIAKLLTPHIYDKLENHESVHKYDNMKGVCQNLFFVDHDHPEHHISEGKSRQNVHEAGFVKSLCLYFIQQGYSPSQITILTTYSGQLHCLQKMMPKAQFQGVRVCVVDKYQGEENDIIILSLILIMSRKVDA